VTKAAAVEEALSHEVFEVGLEVHTIEGEPEGAAMSAVMPCGSSAAMTARIS
jgi:hypothetical protein